MKHYPHHLDLQPVQRAQGVVKLPGSKSISNRILLLAALAEGTTEIKSLLASDDTHVMGFRHASLPIHGVQFHPESIATEHGHDLLANFMRACGLEPKARGA